MRLTCNCKMGAPVVRHARFTVDRNRLWEGMEPLPLSLADFFRASPDPAMLVSAGVVVQSTPAAERIFGSAMAGQPVASLIASPAAGECLRSASATGAEQVLELGPVGRSSRHWLLRVSRVSANCLLVRLVDHSEARAAEQMRVDFVANASHELRTPLATLIGYAETLREQAGEIDSDTRERFLSVIHD